MIHKADTRHAPGARSTRTRSEGMGLVELMVAMTIGVFLIGGALTVYASSRAAYEVNEQMGRVQENLRFAMDVIEPDLRLASYWGLHNWAFMVEGRAGDATPLATAVTNDCAANWAIDLDRSVQGFNATHPGWACLPVAEWKNTTDIVVVRHASESAIATADLDDGKIYVRTDESPRGRLFTGAEPGGFSAQAENHELRTNAYYVRPYTNLLADGTPDNIPSLRRLTLVDGGAAPAIEDQEIISGVDDFQIQFGVDTSAIGAPATVDDLPGEGSVNLYVDADNAILANPDARIASIRIWVLMRTATLEPAFEDDTGYLYADQDFTIDGRADLPQGYRRVLLSRTIELRNL